MFYLKKLLSALALPPFNLILLALVGLWLSRRYPRSGRSLAAVALLGLAALSMPPVGDALMHSLERRPPISVQELARAQAIVILGGGEYYAAPEYGAAATVNRWSLERVRYGVHLQKRAKLPILVTGGAPFGGKPEAETMQEVIVRDFHGEVRWVETESRDTAENAAYSAPLLKSAGISRIALVSHGWHLERAIELFRRQGLEVLPAPMGYTTAPPSAFAQALPSVGALQNSYMALHEWLGIFVQRVWK